MKIFLDTNVLIDYICKREGYPLAVKILDEHKNSDFSRIYVSDSSKCCFHIQKRTAEG